ncbi:hypothetical protein GMST_36550 [Geomonas silvestris]|uniref:histidine kinase n=1 Tax=Geomonas silvestris TaxID=2740184 RepID=A0A6V8MMV6_9BACT|nr:ABC transporter substrate binding protein [Geomonas silvestris]GFO61330.1 hypothetical protein GMST_36550 [Geomonas silvestris]
MGTRHTFWSLVAAWSLAALVALAPPQAAAAPAAGRRPVVLVLNSYHIGYDWSDDELAGVQKVLGSSPLTPTVLVEYLDSKRFPGKTHFSREADLLAAKFRNDLQPDVILAMDNAALEFATKYRPTVFPGKSIVFCGVNDYDPAMIAGESNITGIAENHDTAGTLELALRQFPGTREVLAVHDYTDTGLAMRNEILKTAKRFPNLRVVSAPEQSVEQLQEQLRQLHEGQLVVLLSYVAEKSGRIFTLAEAAGLVSKAARVPVFATHAPQLGHGVLGGIMMTGKAQGEAAARLAEAVLKGQRPEQYPVFTGKMSSPMFDYLQLERFGLNAKKQELPPGSVLINTPGAFYRVDKALVWSSLALIGILALALVAVIINARRQLAIRALEEANHAYRHLLDSVADSIYIFDFAGTIVEANSAALHNSGYSRQQLIGRPIADQMSPELARLAPERLDQIVTRGYALFESIHLSREGREVPVEINAQVAKFHGEPCIISITRDITARKQTEQELRIQAVTLEGEIAERQQVEEQLRQERDNVRSLFDAAPVGMLLIDPDLQVIDSNSALSRLIGTPVEQILGLQPGVALDCRQVLTGGGCGRAPDCSACRLRNCISAALIRGCGTRGVEVQHMLLKGRPHEQLWLRFSVEPVSFDGKRHALVAIDDVSRQRTMEEQILSEKERLAVTLASLGEGVIATDPQGAITLMNRAAQQLTGWQSAQGLGQPLSTVFRLVRKASRLPVQGLERVSDRELVLEAGGHVLLVTDDGRELHVTGSIAPLRDQEQRTIGQVLVFRDMTEKHELENELFQARKLESLGVLAGGLAHDLNNLLTAIIGNISIAEVKARGNTELQPFLSRALKASERTGDLTHQLLTFAKGGAPVKKLTSLQNLVKDSAEFALRGSNIRCEYRIPEQLYPVAVDVGQMSQVINNLVINAKQAMPEGGILTISMENLSRYSMGGARPGRYVRVQVQDRGVGIPAEHLERIFDPYFTTKKTGNGLGLSSVHAIIAKHDGALKVESSVGVGTTFSFVLPATVGGTEVAEPVVEGAFRDSGRVLVMDDDPTIIETLGEMLRLIGYEVVTCAEGRSAVRLFREAAAQGKPFKLALMDLTIPGGLGGEQATRELIRDFPAAKIVVASGYSDSSVMSDYESYGFCAAIAKPFTISEVAEVLRNLSLQLPA